MRLLKRMTALTIGLASFMSWQAAHVEAAVGTPSRLNINVSINANLSVSVDGQSSSTNTLTWDTANPNQAQVNPAGSSVTVKNDSGVSEKWALKALANSINTQTPGGGTWALAGSSYAVGADQYSVQAVFGSSRTAAGSCPAAGASDWNQVYSSTLSVVNQTYTSATFANPNLNQDGDGTNLLYNPDTAGTGQMNSGNLRALCWRVVLPASTQVTDIQNIQIIATALP